MWKYGATSVHLRDVAAAVCRRLCNAIIPWEDIFTLVVNRLIALDKCLGVRPMKLCIGLLERPSVWLLVLMLQWLVVLICFLVAFLLVSREIFIS